MDKSPGERLLVEVQLSDAPGRLVADGRFVVQLNDGLGQLTEPLRSLSSSMGFYRLNLRISELLLRSERDELVYLRELTRMLRKDNN